MIVCFAVANELRDEAGLVAVTVMGIAIASQSAVPVRHVLEFNETLRIVFISGLFVLLGARIEADTLREFEWRNVAFLVALVVIVRPLSIWLSTMRSGLSRNERVFLALTAPRGIVAASIASVFSLQLADLGVENSQILVSATFTIIAGTVLLSGFGSRPLAVRLGLVEPGRDIIIVLGANPVARALATALEAQGAPVRLVDLDRREIAAARMTGLLAHRGSVFADETWEQAGLHNAACFIAVTSNDELNTIAARHAAAALGRKHVFQVPPGRPEHRTWWDLPTGTFARPLFARDVTYTELARRLDNNSKVTATRLTERFSLDDHSRTHPDALVLFIVNAKGGIEIAVRRQTSRPAPGRHDRGAHQHRTTQRGTRVRIDHAGRVIDVLRSEPGEQAEVVVSRSPMRFSPEHARPSSPASATACGPLRHLPPPTPGRAWSDLLPEQRRALLTSRDQRQAMSGRPAVRMRDITRAGQTQSPPPGTRQSPGIVGRGALRSNGSAARGIASRSPGRARGIDVGRARTATCISHFTTTCARTGRSSVEVGGPRRDETPAEQGFHRGRGGT